MTERWQRKDIRDKATLDHADVAALNFINSSAPYVFRRHFRQGLRSHIMEILDPSDVRIEQTGVLVDGVRRFPKAVPRKMFRIFRRRLPTLADALKEITRVRLVEHYLAPDFMATSTECIVEYHGPDGPDLLLCGFQEYICGETLDPWTILDAADLPAVLYETLRGRGVSSALPRDEWMRSVRQKGGRFIEKIKHMVTEAKHIPDLAGVGNLIITGEGNIRLVDINNISPVIFETAVRLDEQGYPVCDKSLEALCLLESKLLNRPADDDENVYRLFLDPRRRAAVRATEESFWKMKKAD
jgi:hypothetical protein